MMAPYMSANNITNLVQNLEDSSSSIFNNQIQRNVTKCHILLSTSEKFITKADSAKTENNQSEKLLGVSIDSQQSLEKHINTIFGKEKVKLSYQILKFISWLFINCHNLSSISKIYSIFTRKPGYKFVYKLCIISENVIQAYKISTTWKSAN